MLGYARIMTSARWPRTGRANPTYAARACSAICLSTAAARRASARAAGTAAATRCGRAAARAPPDRIRRSASRHRARRAAWSHRAGRRRRDRRSCARGCPARPRSARAASPVSVRTSSRLEIDDAAEAGDQMRALELRSGRTRSRRSPRTSPPRAGARDSAGARLRIVGRGRRSHQHHAGALQRIAGLALVDHQRHARVGEDVLGVHGQPRDQQQRRPVGRGRDVHQRAIGVARSRASASPARRSGPRAGASWRPAWGRNRPWASWAPLRLRHVNRGPLRSGQAARQLPWRAETCPWRLGAMRAMLTKPLTNYGFVRGLSHFGLALRASRS